MRAGSWEAGRLVRMDALSKSVCGVTNMLYSTFLVSRWSAAGNTGVPACSALVKTVPIELQSRYTVITCWP